MNALLFSPPEWIGDVAEMIGKKNPGTFVTTNYEQTFTLIKEGRIERLCIIFGGFAIPGDEVAEKVHKVKPELPIMVWDSYGSTRVASNETYLSSRDYNKETFFKKITDGIRWFFYFFRMRTIL